MGTLLTTAGHLAAQRRSGPVDNLTKIWDDLSTEDRADFLELLESSDEGLTAIVVAQALIGSGISEVASAMHERSLVLSIRRYRRGEYRPVWADGNGEA
jgi:succinate dehydrogenase flavin-adding protein (antitoxin of CptAB toxin-antitoxin module)